MRKQKDQTEKEELLIENSEIMAEEEQQRLLQLNLVDIQNKQSYHETDNNALEEQPMFKKHAFTRPLSSQRKKKRVVINMNGTGWLQNRKDSKQKYDDPLLLNIPDLAFGYKTKNLIKNQPPQLNTVQSMKGILRPNTTQTVSNFTLTKNKSTMSLPYQGLINFNSSQNILNSMKNVGRPFTSQKEMRKSMSKDTLNETEISNNDLSHFQQQQQLKESVAEKEAKIIKKNFEKLQELATDDKQIIEKQKNNMQTQKQQYQELLKSYRQLQDDYRKLKINLNAEQMDKKSIKEELEKLKESFNAQDKKINQLQQYVTDCEKQIIKLSSDNLEIKMVEEKTRNSVGAVKKNYENWIDQLNQTIARKDQERAEFERIKETEIKELHEEIEKQKKDYDDLLAKEKVFEEMVNNAKGFKPGTTEFDKMQGKINKLEADLYLYKKVIQKHERDMKKAEEEWQKEKNFLENDTVNLLTELRTVKEYSEQRDKAQTEEIETLKKNYVEVKQEKEGFQDHVDFIMNELKLVKEVNLNFRSENNRLLNQFALMQKQIEDLKSSQFKMNETNIKMKREVQRMTKDLQTVKEEKEVAESEYLEKIHTMKSNRNGGGIDGMSAFELIAEEAKIATQSEFKKMVADKQLELEKRKLEHSEVQQQLEELQQRFEALHQEKVSLETQKEQMISNITDQKEKMKVADNFINEVKANIEGFRQFIERITEIMTCLSCMTYLEQPLMLQCGHSICKECVTKHLHPFKKDSMVLCEKCTQATVAKNLKNSLVLDTLAFCCNEISKGVRRNNQLYDTKGSNLHLLEIQS